MKKVVLGVLALMLAIALVIGGYILLTSGSLEKYEVEEDVSCPYSLRELRNGTYRLEIDTTAYPDGSWGVECYPKNVVAAAEADGKSGTAAFSILPLNVGQTYVQVYCEQTDPFAVRVFEIGVQLSVTEDLEIIVEETEQKDYNGITAMGEEEEHPIQWWADADGKINLLITQSYGIWQAVDYDSARLDVVGPFYRQDSCGFEIQGKQAGTFPLTIYDGETKAIRLEVEVTEELTASITTFAVETYTVDRSEEHAALEAVVGKAVTLPPHSAVTGYSVKSESGSVDFILKDEAWNWEMSTSQTAEELADEIAANAPETKTATVGDVTLTAYSYKEGVVVAWNDGACGMVLNGEREAAIADALAVAGQIVEANHE